MKNPAQSLDRQIFEDFAADPAEKKRYEKRYQYIEDKTSFPAEKRNPVAGYCVGNCRNNISPAIDPARNKLKKIAARQPLLIREEELIKISFMSFSIGFIEFMG